MGQHLKGKTLGLLRNRIHATVLRLGRRRFAQGCFQGNGIEIGALDSPFPVSPGVSVTYVDRLNTDELCHHYPELNPNDLVPVELVDDGEQLSAVQSESQDFVIACHFLEHCQDPIGAINTWLRILRQGGIVLLVVPDKRFTFDRNRPITRLPHHLRDALEGPSVSRSQHYLEWVHFIEESTGEEAVQRAAQLESTSYSIHFHVWDFTAFRALLEHCILSTNTPATLLQIGRNRSENLAIIRKD